MRHPVNAARRKKSRPPVKGSVLDQAATILKAEPLVTLNLVPADGTGTTFNLAPVSLSQPAQYSPPTASPHTPGRVPGPTYISLQVCISKPGISVSDPIPMDPH